MVIRRHGILYKWHFNSTLSVVINRWSHEMWLISSKKFCQKKIFEATIVCPHNAVYRSSTSRPSIKFQMENIRIRSSGMRKEQNFKTGFKKWHSRSDFYFCFLAPPPLTFRFSSPFFFCWVLTRGFTESSCLSYLEFSATTHFFLASFSIAYFLAISPASHPFRTPTSRISLLPFPYPTAPTLLGSHPHTPLHWGQVVAISYYALILIVAKFLPSPLDWSARQLFTRPHSIGCENNRHRNITKTIPHNGAACYQEPMKLEVFKSCVPTAWTHYSACPKRFETRGPVPPFRLEHVTEVNWPRRPGKTLYRD